MNWNDIKDIQQNPCLEKAFNPLFWEWIRYIANTTERCDWSVSMARDD